jgi:threonine aldolase
MTARRFEFLSDNTAGACPEAMSALCAHNQGFMPGYGADAVTQQAADAVRALLDADADVYFIASGTAGNALACAALCRSFEAVLAHAHAHLITHETGAANFFGQGLSVRGLAGSQGKIEADALRAEMRLADAANRQSAAALSLTNATECGTVYTNAELIRLCALGTECGLRVHIDGARLANAIAAGFDARTLGRGHADILVLGGTKSGAPLSDAMVLFNKRLSRRFDARLKQAGHLCSKSRFLAAPWLGLLENRGLEETPWILHARHANAMARKLAASIPYKILYPVDANSVFVEMDGETFDRLQSLGWRMTRFSAESVRFVCSWAVTDEAVEEFAHALRTVG